MNRHSRKQRGAILPMMAILIIVLIGIAALALDMGRLFVQRSELQNAADAAALAAAAELDGESGAQARAIAAARQLMGDRGIYFGDFTPEEDITDFIFYSSIGTRSDPEKVVATGDVDSVYVELTVDLTQEGEGVPLFFLPVLSLLSDDVPTEGGTKARALAGKQTYECFEPPMFMCVDGVADWYDGNSANDPIKPGQMIYLKAHGGGDHWTPGDFGFLEAPEGHGASALGDYLASAGESSCVPAVITSEPGEMANPARRGLNTRFDIYDHMDPDDFPPAPNIINYPRDPGLGGGNRIGNNNWNRSTYWATYHGAGAIPPDLGSWTRLRMYEYELGLIDETGAPQAIPVTSPMPTINTWGTAPCDPTDTGTFIPNLCLGEPDPAHFWCLDGDDQCYDAAENDLFDAVYDGLPAVPPYDNDNPTLPVPLKDEAPATNPDRRVMYVAVLDCATIEEEISLNGKIKDLAVEPPNGAFAKMFLTEYVKPGGSGDPFEFYAEFTRVVGDVGTGETRVVIQLYE